MIRHLMALFLALPLCAELSLSQREIDFRTLASRLSREYAPLEWKRQLLNFDLRNITPWLERVRNAKSDLEYLDICAEYVASLRDSHSAFFAPTDFLADLGIVVDIYDGKVLIEFIDRSKYPASRFPFVIGDELVSLDDRTAEQWIEYLSRFRGFGTPAATRRLNADSITYRGQTIYPSAALVEDTAKVVIRRANGELETYTLTWEKTGLPLKDLSRLPPLRVADLPMDDPETGLILRLPSLDPALRKRVPRDEDGNPLETSGYLGFGSVTPVWSFPAAFSFNQRLGRSSSDRFYSGTFQTENLRIGFIRIPQFTSTGVAAAAAQFASEVAFFNANTDGLVIDVMRNPGGGCVGLDYISALMPAEFTPSYIQVPPRLLFLNVAEQNYRNARLLNAPDWHIAMRRIFYQELLNAYESGSNALSDAFPTCGIFELARMPSNTLPGTSTAYNKPMIVLTDELSASFADVFAAILQDNRRALVVGMPTNGAGGVTLTTTAGNFSEAQLGITIGLLNRARPVDIPGVAPTRIIESLGVQPDVSLDYMTRENLTTRGRPFVEAFARIAAEHIRGTR